MQEHLFLSFDRKYISCKDILLVSLLQTVQSKNVFSVTMVAFSSPKD